MKETIDSELYAALPPDKKEEYKKLFQEPIIEPIIQPKICVDDRIPEGYALFGNQFVALPDAQTCTSEKIKPFDIEELRSLFKTWEKLEPDIINGSYCLKLADEICKESMRKKIEEDMEKRLKEAEHRDIMRFWFCL